METESDVRTWLRNAADAWKHDPREIRGPRIAELFHALAAEFERLQQQIDELKLR